MIVEPIKLTHLESQAALRFLAHSGIAQHPLCLVSLSTLAWPSLISPLSHLEMALYAYCYPQRGAAESDGVRLPPPCRRKIYSDGFFERSEYMAQFRRTSVSCYGIPRTLSTRICPWISSARCLGWPEPEHVDWNRPFWKITRLSFLREDSSTLR